MTIQNNCGLIGIVEKALRLNDPACFGPCADPSKIQARELTLMLIRRLVTTNSASSTAEPETAALWHARAALATVAQRLRWATDSPFEQALNGTSEQTIIDLVMRRLVCAFAGDVPAIFRDLVRTVVVGEVAKLPTTADSIEIARNVRAMLARIGLLLQRASACIWTLLLSTSPTADARSDQRMASPQAQAATREEASDYLSSLHDFAAKLDALKVDPATLPVGEQVVAEAEALCAVRHFVERRFGELRRWVVPQAAVEGSEEDRLAGA